jgi:hypothetical protein
LPDQHGPRPVAAGRSRRADAGPGPLRQAISRRQARMRPLDRFRARDPCCAIDPSSPSAPRRRRMVRASKAFQQRIRCIALLPAIDPHRI